MNAKEAIITALKEYRAITGLRSYLIEDEDDINSAAEKNYFCKCLKTSAAALRHCEECTSENYRNALQSGNNVNTLLADASVVWRLKKVRLSAEVRNLFNKRRYTVTTYSGVMSSTDWYELRPREVVVGVQVRL